MSKKSGFDDGRPAQKQGDGARYITGETLPVEDEGAFFSGAALASECTGLTPTPARDEAESSAYDSLRSGREQKH